MRVVRNGAYVERSVGPGFMTKSSGILFPVLGGVALLLGAAYGWTARDHRGQELIALTDRVTQLEERSVTLTAQAAQNTKLEAKVSELETALAAALEEAEAAKQAAEAAAANPALISESS